MNGNMDRAPDARDEQILGLLRKAGSLGLPAHGLSPHLGIPDRTLRYAVAGLVARGLVERPKRGVYRIADRRSQRKAPLATESGRRIWRVLADEDAAAYISGLDVIGGRAHQFIMGFPHMVVAQTGRAGDVDFALSRAGFAVRPMREVPLLGDADSVVLLSEGRGWIQPIYQVREHVAPPELAWLDLYRAARDGNYPIRGGELGRILADLLTDPGFEQRFRVLARRHLAHELLPIIDDGRVAGFAADVAYGLRG
jgi:hypothetical protein